MPEVKDVKDEVGSVYARKAYQLGYLKIENVLPVWEFDSLIQRIVAGDFSWGCDEEKILEEMPPRSYQTGRTWCYVSEELDQGWVYFDFASIFTEGKGYSRFLRSIRWPDETFEDGFELTKEGYEHTRRGVAFPELDMDSLVQELTGGKRWKPDESFPVKKQFSRESRWKHLWA